MDKISKYTGPGSMSLPAQIFPGESEMAHLMRATDWAATPLGPVESWSSALRMMVRFLIPNRFPLLLWWGPHFVQLYNDPYRPVLGSKHPESMGQPASECWSEIWDVIGPLIETPFNGGPATWSEDIFLEVNRHGFLEETHFTIAYSPVPDDTAPNGIGGVLATVHEISDKTVADRRVIVLRDLAARASEAKSAEEACQIAAQIVEQHARDIPFALLYLTDADGKYARLAATAGVGDIADDSHFCPRVVSLADADASGETHEGQNWPLAEVLRTDAIQAITDLSARFDAVPPGPWSDPPTDAVIVPIRSNIAHQLAGFLVAGVSARLKFDDAYAGFYELVSGQFTTAIANARAYEEERKRAEALAAIDRAKTTFFSNVSHEFRTPLTLILGPLDDSLADPDATADPRQRERLEVMRRNASRLLKLVNTLLDFARIEAGRIQAVYEPTDLCAYTADLASAFRSLIEKAGLALNVDCALVEDLPTPVYVDREMWEKIVLNLLSNAFKFTFEGSITVTLSPVRGDDGTPVGVELAVRDTGTGIPAAEAPRLFERFRRVEGARSRTHEGSGIGLALVQELVHLHGGTISVESVEGEGTTFFVRLPLGSDHLPIESIAPDQSSPLASTALGAMVFVEEAGRWLPDESDANLEHIANGRGDTSAGLSLSAVTTPGRIAATNGHRARVLVADDNSDMRDYLRRLLSERYIVTAVANGAQALASIQNHPEARPDLVLADVMMPELDGFGLLRAIRGDPATATLPVILLSARAGEEATVEGLEAGADDYLVKPFSGREVLSRIEARLEVSRLRAASEQRMRRTLDAILRMAQTLFEAPDDLPVTQADMPTEEEHLVAHRLALLTCEVLGCARVGIIAIEPETEALRAVALVGLPPDQERQWWAEQRAQEARGARLGEGGDPDKLARFRAGEVFVIDMTKPPYDTLPNPYQITTSLVAPMRAGDRLVGMLSLDYGGPPHTFTDDERALAAAVGHLGAVALEREHLLRVSAEAKAGELAAVEARRRMDDFMGIASHELRTPLTSITANVQMARRQLEGLIAATPEAHSTEQQAQLDRLQRSALLLERMDRQMTRMDRLVSDLVDSARIQAGKLELRPEACDLLAITQDAVHEQRSAWPHRPITLTLPRRAVVPIYADADRVGQVVTNLLTNALKYSQDDTTVAVTIRIQGDVVRVEVRDQGPGLSVKQQAHLFERFYRVPGVEQQSGSGVGLGLGLNICKNIIERHGGGVGVTSAPGSGSVFWFTLPLQREHLRRGEP